MGVSTSFLARKSELFLSPFKMGTLAVASVILMALGGCQMPGFDSGSGRSGPGAAQGEPCVVLALPASGPYAAIAGRIKRGVSLARQELQASGVPVRIEEIDTQAPDWLQKLDALPAQCAMVGGPLQDSAYSQARKANALEKRVFFSFLPTLQAGDEGTVAWRFFPGPKDQINALARFVIDDLNIRSFGAFYPNDTYGQRMTALLEDELGRRQLTLHKAAYNPAAPATWSDAVRPLIQPTLAAGSRTPIPQTPFEAIFLPDSWKNMDMLTTSLMHNGEDRLILMGTTLWESGLEGKSQSQPAKYALAVFPGAWDKSKAPTLLQSAGNDFWSALGFDFVNFAVASGIYSRLAAQAVNAQASKGASAIRALAPMRWNASGQGSQDLYLFQVAPAGMKPLDIEEFGRARQSVMEQAAFRMQGLTAGGVEEDMPGETEIGEAAATPPAAVTAPPAAPVTVPQGQVLSTTPQPSYKLRLPTRQ